MRIREFAKLLSKTGACESAIEWVKKQKGGHNACWKKCNNPGWLLWLIWDYDYEEYLNIKIEINIEYPRAGTLEWTWHTLAKSKKVCDYIRTFHPECPISEEKLKEILND